METRPLIGRERVASQGAALEVENPATEETVAHVGTPSAEQLDAALAVNEWWYPYALGGPLD